MGDESSILMMFEYDANTLIYVEIYLYVNMSFRIENFIIKDAR